MRSLQTLLLLSTLLTTSARTHHPSSLTPLASRTKTTRTAFLHKSTTRTPEDARAVRGGGGGEATMANEMFNMVKAVVGVGVLSLPAGE
jgi:hypothetical protein